MNIKIILILYNLYILNICKINYKNEEFSKLINTDETKLNILKFNDKFKGKNISESELTILGYITPWNKNGYVISKEYSQLFSMISPVLYDVIEIKDSFEIKGEPLDKNWSKSIKNQNSNIKIIPRLHINPEMSSKLFTQSTSLETEYKILEFSTIIRTWVLQNNFDGIVFECNLLLSGEFGSSEGYLWVRFLAEQFNQHNLTLVVVLPPIYENIIHYSSQYITDIFQKLLYDVSYFSLMTYDYSSYTSKIGPIAPLYWLEECLTKFTTDINQHERSKILLGLNFYGRVMNPNLNAFNGNNLLQLLMHSSHVQINWNPEHQEHIFKIKTHSNDLVLTYPTLMSIYQRLQLAKKYGTGIAIWELGQGLDYFMQLL